MKPSYFMIPRCVNKRPVGGKQCIKIQKQKAPGGNSELGGEENCMFAVGTGVLSRREEEWGKRRVRRLKRHLKMRKTEMRNDERDYL